MLRAQVYTAPQFLQHRFGRSARLGFSATLLVASIFIDAAAALYAGGAIVQALFPILSFRHGLTFNNGLFPSRKR